jgi:hypothetical protein
MSDIHDAVTTADVRDFQLGINMVFNTFFYKTTHPLDDLLGPGYFDSVIEVKPRRNDRIEVVASCDSSQPEHATLAVKEVNHKDKRVVVSVLFCNR